MIRPERVVIAGASMGGLRAAEQLRAQGFGGEITVVGAEPYFPYNRPPLSKEVLARRRDEQNSSVADWHAEVAFRQRKNTADVRWLLGTAVRSSNLAAHTVTLGDGTVLGFDGLVIATGLRPRRLDLGGAAGGRHVIRSLDDAIALRAALRPGARVVVVGGGFIGCEAAATASALGCAVHIVEPQPAPMIRPLGEDLGNVLRRVHEAHGVTVHAGVGVAELVAGDRDRLTAVKLTDGTGLEADVLIESVGSHPNTEWLDGNGLDLSDGVLCDNHMRAARGVVAVGDVARFADPTTCGTPRRIEHWCIPADTAKRAARTLIADLRGDGDDTDVFSPLPSFWSDQYDVRIQGYGTPGAADHVAVIEGELDRTATPTGLVVGYHRSDRLVGVVMVSPSAKQNTHYRTEIETARRALQPA